MRFCRGSTGHSILMEVMTTGGIRTRPTASMVQCDEIHIEGGSCRAALGVTVRKVYRWQRLSFYLTHS